MPPVPDLFAVSALSFTLLPRPLRAARALAGGRPFPQAGRWPRCGLLPLFSHFICVSSSTASREDGTDAARPPSSATLRGKPRVVAFAPWLSLSFFFFDYQRKLIDFCLFIVRPYILASFLFRVLNFERKMET